MFTLKGTPTVPKWASQYIHGDGKTQRLPNQTKMFEPSDAGSSVNGFWVQVLLPLYCTFSLISSHLPPFPLYSIHVYRQCVTVGWRVGGGGVEMYCGPYSAGVLHSVSDQIHNLQNCFTTPNKNDQ
jgi:hypothetical protein